MRDKLKEENPKAKTATAAEPQKKGGRLRCKVTDKVMLTIFTIAGMISALMIILILFFVAERGVAPFLPSYPEPQKLGEFLSGNRWRADQGIYSVFFIFVNTILTAAGASLLAFPVSVLSALMIAKIAPPRIGQLLSTTVELLAAIPSVVFGVFASGRITLLVDTWAKSFGLTTFGGNSMLSVIFLLAIMIAPTITTLAVTAIRAVPHQLEEASLALGATLTETRFKVVIPAARSGIYAGLLLGIGRAFGEATAVSMVAGNAFVGPTWNPFDITRTLTSTMLSGLHETVGVDYDIRFSVGLVLMITVLISNLLIQGLKRKSGTKAGS